MECDKMEDIKRNEIQLEVNYPTGTYDLKTFADNNLIPAVKFKKLFDKYRHLFPKYWKIYKKGRGYYIET
jgi:hypothetical protein